MKDLPWREMVLETYRQFTDFSRRFPDLIAGMLSPDAASERDAYLREYLLDWKEASPQAAEVLNWELSTPLEPARDQPPGRLA